MLSFYLAHVCTTVCVITGLKALKIPPSRTAYSLKSKTLIRLIKFPKRISGRLEICEIFLQCDDIFNI